MKNTLIFRAKIYKMCHYGLFSRKNGTLISFLLWIRVQIFKIGRMVHHSWLPMKNPRSMPQAILCSHTSRISKRKLHVVQTDDIFSFVNLGLNSHPTFFGCNASNFTSYSRTPPLIVYFPHVGWTGFTNYSTFTLQYTPAEVEAFIDNGVATAVIQP